jgi:wobble nucleotide-excising tRNase
MIKKIDIDNFGSYNNYTWGLEECDNFNGRNIIYGRNYSGKTTLSRMFRCIEKKSLHDDFMNGKFTLKREDGTEISQNNIDNQNLKIRVYNSDFRQENLSFLYYKQGEITPFAILGEKNIEIEKEINEKKEIIEIESKKLGKECEKNTIISDYKKIENEIKALERNIEKQLKDKASKIKINSELFKHTSTKRDYNIRDIKKELEIAKKISIAEKDKIRSIIKEVGKDNINILSNFNNDFDKIMNNVVNILSKEVKPSKSIEYLLKNIKLQEWVRQGIEEHKGKRETCAFCGSIIQESVWHDLDAHFTKEADIYKTEINKYIQVINTKLNYISNYTLPNRDDFYTEFQEIYSKLELEWKGIKEIYINNLNILITLLQERSNDIFKKNLLEESKIKNVCNEAQACIDNINKLIIQNNEYSSDFLNKQNQERMKLRLDEISNFIDDIKYVENINRIDSEKIKLKEKEVEKNEIEKSIFKILSEIKELEGQLNDEIKVANQVNIYLKNFLGHPELSLGVDKLENKSRFIIKRNEEIAYNLSEGEQSLISFCYFLATLKDISNNSEYIIFIDDPICSLDGDNIFYIFSLLDSEIAKKDYKQVFISTHNLDFLKYVQKLQKPSGNSKYKNKYYMIQRSENSEIIAMPLYLRKHTTEFIYLFEQIYRVANENQTDENYHVFYNFPNSARKFLESYMFFKYPDTNLKNDEKLNKFFDGNLGVVSLINRINNEFSHGEDQFDRLVRPIDIAEFKKDAKLILETIHLKDEEQYSSFCSSIAV